jgi:hypothetical protein
MAETYRTERGSRVEISGKHRGISVIDFDWFEEGACFEAKRNVVAEVYSRRDEPYLFWSCDCCEPGQAPLIRCEP